MSPNSHRRAANLIAQYDTAEGCVEFHGTAGGITVFVGERMVQKDLGMRDFACYMAHCLQASHYKLAHPSETEPLKDALQVALDEFAIGSFNAERRQRAVEFIRAALKNAAPQDSGTVRTDSVGSVGPAGVAATPKGGDGWIKASEQLPQEWTPDNDAPMFVLGWFPGMSHPKVEAANSVRYWTTSDDPIPGAQWQPLPDAPHQRNG